MIGEEAGGQIGGIGGGALATAGCIGFGIATEGVGLFLCGLAGGALGAATGTYLGGGLSGAINDAAEEAYLRQLRLQGDFPPEAASALDFWLGPPLF